MTLYPIVVFPDDIFSSSGRGNKTRTITPIDNIHKKHVAIRIFLIMSFLETCSTFTCCCCSSLSSVLVFLSVSTSSENGIKLY